MYYQLGSGSSTWNVVKRNRSVGTEACEQIKRMVSGSAVVVFSMSTCCMCHAVKRLFSSMGVSPTVYEMDEQEEELERALRRVVGGTALPLVFIGGKLVGAMDSVMASHINGTLVPLLKDAGALWL